MKEDSESKTLRAVADAKKGAQDEVILSTGVVLRAVKVNPIMLIRVMTRFARPKPPVVFDKIMGRDMENPDDPDYISQVKAWDEERNTMVLNALILLGTEIVSVPKGVEGPKGDKWVNKYKLLGMPIKEDDEDWRKLNWISMVAAADENDMVIIQDAVAKLTGIAEADVKSAEQFPGSDS